MSQDILEALPPEYLGALLTRLLRARGDLSDDDRRALRCTVTNFVCGHIGVLDAVLQRPTWVAANGDLVQELLHQAWKIARGPAERNWVRSRAELLGAKGIPGLSKVLFAGDSDRAGETFLTDSQREAVDELEAIARVFFRGAREGVVQPRWTTLLAGPTGIGKSHVVRLVTERLGLPTFRFTTASWQPTGSKAEPHSLKVVLDAVRRGERFVLHLEELDKLVAKTADTWSQSQLSELLMLLDGAIGAPWTDQDREQFRRHALIIASGAFQAVFEHGRPPIGFGAGADSLRADDYACRIHLARQIPTELMARFGRLVVLDPLNEADFSILANAIGLEPSDYEGAEGVRSGQNMRYLESMVARRELKRERALMRRERGNGRSPHL